MFPLPEVFPDFGKMATQDAVHTGIHVHCHACALHMRVATTISAMNAKDCTRWCHMRPTVRPNNVHNNRKVMQLVRRVKLVERPTL